MLIVTVPYIVTVPFQYWLFFVHNQNTNPNRNPNPNRKPVQLYYTGTSMRPISVESPFHPDYKYIFFSETIHAQTGEINI